MPELAVLCRENDTTWTLYPYAQPPMSLTNEQAHVRMHPDAPQSTTAAIIVYATQNQGAPTRRESGARRSGPGRTCLAPPHRRASRSPSRYSVPVVLVV